MWLIGGCLLAMVAGCAPDDGAPESRLSAPGGLGQQVSPVVEATATIVDNLDPAVSWTGVWGTLSGGNFQPYEGSSRYSTGPDDVWAWHPVVPQAGSYEVYAWWVPSVLFGTDIPYTIHHQDGSTSVPVNQQDRASAAQWNYLGTFNFGAGEAVIDIRPTATGRASADAILLSPAQTEPVDPLAIVTTALPTADVGTPYTATIEATGGVPPYSWTSLTVLPAGLSLDAETGTLSGTPQQYDSYVILAQVTDATGEAVHADVAILIQGSTEPPADVNLIVDDLDPDAFATGYWATNSSSTQNYELTSRFAARTSSVWTWSATLPAAGQYDVYAWWVSGSTFGTDIPYTIYHRDGSSQVRVDQRDPSLGGQWNYLGRFDFATGETRVDVRPTSTGRASADAIRFVAASTSQASCGNGVLDTGETCDDGNTAPNDGCSSDCQQELGGVDFSYRDSVDLHASGISYDYSVLTLQYHDANLGVTCSRDVFYYVPRTPSKALRAIVVFDSSQGVTTFAGTDVYLVNPQDELGVSRVADRLGDVAIIQLQGTKSTLTETCIGSQTDDGLGIETGFKWNHYPNVPSAEADDVNFVLQAVQAVRADLPARYPGHGLIAEGINLMGHSNGMMMGATVAYMRPDQVRSAVFYKFGDLGAYNVTWCSPAICPGDISDGCLNPERNVLSCLDQEPSIVKLTNQVPVVLIDEEGMEDYALPPCREFENECSKSKPVQNAERLIRFKKNFGVVSDGEPTDYEVLSSTGRVVTLRLYTPLDASGKPISGFRYGTEVGLTHERTRGSYELLIERWLREPNL